MTPREFVCHVSVTDTETFRTLMRQCEELQREVNRLHANEREAHRLALLAHQSWPRESQPSRDLYRFILEECGPSCD